MALTEAVTFTPDLEMPMRDGTVLRADVYRPSRGGPWPVVLARTPYDKQLGDPARPWLRFASAGYAVVVQDCRGCFASDGIFTPFADETDDGYDTIEWLADQPWTTGRTGMFGTSYLGVTQWLAAVGAPPHLTTIVPAFTAADYHEGWIYQSGAFLLSFALGWSLPFAMRELQRRERTAPGRSAGLDRLAEVAANTGRAWATRPLVEAAPFDDIGVAGYYGEWLSHPDDDCFWGRWRVADRYERVIVPVLAFSGWYDMFLAGTITNHLGMVERGGAAVLRPRHRLVLGPWAHGKPLFGGNPDPQFDFGPRASGSAIDVDGLALRWFDHWLRDADNGVTDEAPVEVFTLGANRWHGLPAWPPPARPQRWYLGSHGEARTSDGDGVLSPDGPSGTRPDAFLFDPRDPVPTHGGRAFMNDGARDQRLLELRPDVLVYTSAPLDRALPVTGSVTVRLWASTSAADTDFTAKLVDVFPDGRAMNLADNIIRARYRSSVLRADPVRPNDPVEYSIDLSGVSVVFAVGHRIRLEISSSNFPRFDVNPNTGGACATETHVITARQTVFHDAEHPSWVELPVADLGTA